MNQLNQTMADAAAGAYVAYFIPCLLIGGGIAIFFSLMNKNPEKAVIGCGSVCALGFVIGLLMMVVEFIKTHVMLCLCVGVVFVLICLVIFMIYTPPSPPKTKDENDSIENKDNPFYEGPR